MGDARSRWILRDTSQGGPLFDSPATYAAPEDDSLADTSAADYAAMTPFGQNQVVAARAARRLRRLEMRGADALLRGAGRLFELRLPRLDKVKEARASDDAA